MPVEIPASSPPDNPGIGLFFVHTVQVETFAGTGAYGDTYQAAVTVPCFVDDSTHLVRNKSGEEVVSSTIVFASPSQTSTFLVDSRVTVNGRMAYVISTNSHDSGPLGLPDHVEAHLT